MPSPRSNLSQSRHGVYVWRKVHPITKKRVKRSTRTKNLRRALREAAKFEDEFEKLKLGIPVARHDAQLELLPLVPAWLEDAKVGVATKRWMAEKNRNLREALRVLKINVAADLEDLPSLSKRLSLVGGALRRRRLQDELHRFVRWLSEDQRYLPADPLLNWKRVRKPITGGSEPHALAPEEAAWTLQAMEVLDHQKRRKVGQRMPLLLLLISGSRIGALCDREVSHLDRPGQRIHYGVGSGKKRRGEGALDFKTFAELEAYLGRRDSGPLCQGPRGGRVDTSNLRKDFTEAHSLAAVRMSWPEGEPFNWELASLVGRQLSTGRTPLKAGSRIKPETLRVRAALTAKVNRISADIEVAWRAIVFKQGGRRVGPHELRDTIETWCRDLGISATAIDKQLGHAGATGSATGRRFYYDQSLKAPEFEEVTGARLVATKVREVLDSALERIHTDHLRTED